MPTEMRCQSTCCGGLRPPEAEESVGLTPSTQFRSTWSFHRSGILLNALQQGSSEAKRLGG